MSDDQNNFFGELHFVGKTGKEEIPKTKSEVVLDGITGFYNLAEACIGQDPKIDDINTFYGISTLIDKRFEKWGFSVLDIPEEYAHQQGKLKTIKGFESFTHAKSWLNGYFIQQRMKKFTDCFGKFKSLNGKSSLQLTQHKNPKIFT